MVKLLWDEVVETIWLRGRPLREEYVYVMIYFSLYMFFSKIIEEEIVDTFGGKEKFYG